MPIESNLLNHFIFPDFFLIEDYQQGALGKKPATAPFIDRLKTTLWESDSFHQHLEQFA